MSRWSCSIAASPCHRCLPLLHRCLHLPHRCLPLLHRCLQRCLPLLHRCLETACPFRRGISARQRTACRRAADVRRRFIPPAREAAVWLTGRVPATEAGLPRAALPHKLTPVHKRTPDSIGAWRSTEAGLPRAALPHQLTPVHKRTPNSIGAWRSPDSHGLPYCHRARLNPGGHVPQTPTGCLIVIAPDLIPVRSAFPRLPRAALLSSRQT